MIILNFILVKSSFNLIQIAHYEQDSSINIWTLWIFEKFRILR